MTPVHTSRCPQVGHRRWAMRRGGVRAEARGWRVCGRPGQTALTQYPLLL